MPDTSTSNKRIAKNTLLLYIRTIFVMVISLYTSRVVLSTLGVENFGIYNVVGGVVAMFGMISGALSSAISRFITFELGRGDIAKLKRIFSTSINIQLGISLIVILVGETLGLWFLNCKMNIPADRMYAANWVLHCSLIVFAINLISVPYNAIIIAYERMSVFAYVSILEVALKLAIVYMLYISQWDKLITFSVLQIVVAVCIRLVYGIYCSRHFEETQYEVVHDRQLMKEMFVFGGWMFLGATAGICSTQGTNLLLNLFYGVVLNAAVGVCNQVNVAVNQFVSNFQTAFTPQIVKLYAIGDLPKLQRLLNRSSRFSFLLLFAVACPLILNIDFVLKVWLKTVPEHSSSFCALILVYSLIEAISKPIGLSIHATGRVKHYNIFMSIALFMNIVLSFIFLELGFLPEIVPIISIFVCILCLVIRLIIAKRFGVLYIREYASNVVLRLVFITIITLPIPIYISKSVSSWSALFVTSFVFLLIFGLAAYFIGLTKSEQTEVRKFVLRKFLLLKK